MTPRELVSELDRFIVGQAAAKRPVAVALRNRWPRMEVPGELREEETESVQAKARERAEERIISELLPDTPGLAGAG